MKLTDRHRFWLVVALGLLGLLLISVAWWRDGDWESVAIEVGAALALVVVIVVAEDWYRAGITETLDQQKREIDERFDETDRKLSEVREAVGIRDAQEKAVERRRSGIDEIVGAFIEAPGPATAAALGAKCSQLGIAATAEVKLDNGVRFTMSPRSEQLLKMVIDVPRVGRDGRRDPSRRTLDWSEGQSLDDFVARVDDALASIGQHPGTDFELADVIAALGNSYGRRFAERYGET